NTFSPPPLPGTMVGTQFSHFSPSGTPQSGFPFPPALPSPVVAPPNFGNFHNSRQSISFQGGIIPGLPMPSPGQHEWESYNMFPPQRTPPFQGLGWSSPYGRGGSPALLHMFNNNGMNGSYAPVLENNSVLSSTVSDFSMAENMFQNGAQLFAERLQQQHQQVRRGSPLAHVKEASVEESELIVEEKQGPTIVEPVPKHRRNEPSISLQREMQGVEKEENVVEKPEVCKEESEDGVNNSGFVTNPVSPAPPNYLNQNGDTLQFPDQPEMPNLETDVHIGAELASSPNDDVTDPESEANERKEAAMGGDNSSINNIQPVMPLQDAKSFNQYYNPHSQDSSQNFLPPNHFLNSRTSANSIQAQIQHDYDSPDPIQHSAMAMLIAGDDLHHNGVLSSLGMGDEHLSEDARTNISDILTNPSVPNSPRRKFSVTAVGQHTHHLSNGSNHSDWAVMDHPEISKTRTSEFKYDPTATFMFSPSTFKSAPPPPPPKDTSIGGFDTKSFNVAAPSFTPSSTFNFKATSFDPAVPSFTPSYTTPSFPPEIVRPPPVKRIIPIVRPPSRKEEQRAAEEETDPRDPKSQEGGRKRTRHEPVLEDKVEEQDLKDKELQMPVIGEKGEVKELAHREDIEIENKEEPQLEGIAEALMAKSPTGLIKDFNPYELKKMSEMEEFANARPSTTFDHARGKSNRTPDTAEDGSLSNISIDETSFMIANSSLLQDQGPSPPPVEAQPPPPPVGRRTSILAGNSFSFEFKGAESKVPHLQQPLTPKTTGMAASIYAYIPSPPNASSPAAPPSIVSPALSNPYFPAASPPQEEEEKVDKKLKPRSVRSKSLKKTLQLSDQELDEIVNTITDMDPPYLSRHEEDHGLEEDDEDDLEEAIEDNAVPWKPRAKPKRPALDGIFEAPPVPPYCGLHPDEPRRSAAPSPMPKHYRHRAASFSADEVRESVRPAVSSYKPPELPLLEKYRSTAIGITTKVDSDWDDMISEGDNIKLHPQSRMFFDAHVEELVGALLKAHVDPLEKSLATIQEALAELSTAQIANQARRKLSTHSAESDADDEDDGEEDDVRPPSAKRGPKLEKIKAALLEALSSVNLAVNTPDRLNENLSLRSKALEELSAVIERRQSGGMTMITKSLNGLEEAVNAKDNIVVDATKSLEKKLNEAVKSNNLALDEVNNTIGTQLELVDESIQATRKEIEEKAYWLGRKLTEATHKLERSAVERQDNVVEIAKALEQRLLDYSLITIENNKALENNLFRKSDAVLETTRALQSQFDNTHCRQDVMSAETRSMAQRIVEFTKSLEAKMQDRDKVIYEATKNLENRLYERDIAMVMDARQFVEERFREQRLKERDEAVVEDAMKAFDDRLNKNQQDMADTRKQIERLINRDHESLVELTQGLEDALKQRDIAMSSETATAIQSLEERIIERESNDSVIQELRATAEDILDKQRRLLEDGHKRVGGVEMEELQKRQGVLESLLEESRSNVRAEADLRREAQQRIVELETGLSHAEEERDRQKELAQEAEKRLRSSDEKRQQALNQAQMRSALLEGAHSSLQKSLSDLSARNAVLEGSLYEAKAAGERLREDNGIAQNENRELRRTIESLKSEMEESIRVREGFRGKFNKLQEDMRTAQTEINREQARAARRDEEQKARIEVLEARLAAEAKSKEWFEREVERLRAEEREAIRLKVELEHVKRYADKTEELSDRLRAESLEQQRKMAILQVDVENARQSARDENTRHEADRMRNAALQEQHRKYELQLVDIRSHHERTLANAREDADRNQATLRQNLSMANNQIEHLKERIAHLEDKLNVATTAAQAAAQAAQIAKTSPNCEPRGSVTGEKVSSQALRESIMALQEQLGEREARVEELEQQLTTIEKETSKKLKDSDLEVSWLRELLTVRVNELEEITKALQSPTFDRETIRDAAVRLKANLQMEQQVRERGINGTATELGSSVVANVTELAKQLPLAAAWGSWRIRGKAKEEPQASPARSPATQPSAPATSQPSFLSGFLTPPNMASATSKLASRLPDIGSVNFSTKTRPALALSEYDGNPAISEAGGGRRDTDGRHMSQETVTGATPQSLMRRGSYDDDADVSVLGMRFCGDGSSAGYEDFGVGDDVPPFRTAAYFSG
ncbi:hypothetical protein EV426DRAFT_527066, partial [Tirmania nivea]